MIKVRVFFLKWLSCSTVKDKSQLSDHKGPGTLKLDWRYFEHNKVDRNELQICKNLHKGTGAKITEKLNNLTEKMGHFCSCAFMQIFANLEFIPINLIVFKVPPVQFWSPWSKTPRCSVNCLPFSMFITRPNNYESNRLSYQDEALYGLFREKASPGLLI